MREQLLIALLLVISASAILARKHLWGTEEERSVAISEAISEAKLSAQLKEEAAKAKEAAKAGKFTAADFLTRGFKKPSPEALKEGKARLLLEDMVKRAEKKLEELKRSQSHSQSIEEEAEQIAEELVHTPGTLLSYREIDRMANESKCLSPQQSQINCNRQRDVNKFRIITGICNNLRNPTQGARGMKFRRLIPGVYEDGISAPLGRMQAQSFPEEVEQISQIMKIGPFVPPRPSARLISKSVVRDRQNDEMTFTHILMQWGQFLDHDLDLGPEMEAECEGCEFTDICEPIRVPKDDQVFGVGTSRGDKCLPFRRSLPSCDTNTHGSFSPREQLNDLTSYIDASMVYGSTIKVANAVRSKRNGLLRVGRRVAGRDSLPVDTQGLVACSNGMRCFLCGDVRCNEQIGLTVMHTVWVREHNRIAQELRRLNPSWNDERLYQEARKIVGAIIQKITYFDFLPKVLGPAIFNKVIGPYRGYNDTVDAGVPNAFATAAFRFGHSLIRPYFDRLGPRYTPLPIGRLNLRDAFFNPNQFRMSGGAAPILRGLVTAKARKVDEFMNTVLTTQLFQRSDTDKGMDLASLNIHRSRDHGLPGYLTWKNFCQRLFNLTSDTENQLTFVKFLQLYGSLETVELWVGGLAEDRLPNSLLGATFACIFGLTFQNVRDGDRFYFENPGVFTRRQLAEIRKSSLSRILCDNSNINSIQPDAFLTHQRRRSCRFLRSMDLSAWQESSSCYARIRMPRRIRRMPPRLILRTRTRGSLSDVTTSARSRCLPFQCPTSPTSFSIEIPRHRRSRRCSIRPHRNGPQDGSSLRNVYSPRGFLPTSFFTARNGFFSSLRSCMRRSRSPVVARITCRSRIMNTVEEEDEDSEIQETENSETQETEDNITLDADTAVIPEEEEEEEEEEEDTMEEQDNEQATEDNSNVESDSEKDDLTNQELVSKLTEDLDELESKQE